MELKYDRIFVDKTLQTCSNRTFMELKLIISIMLFNRIHVLIVPLWNWNIPIEWNLAVISCSNRTFMELKSIRKGILISREKSSNRTFMELKYV